MSTDIVPEQAYNRGTAVAARTTENEALDERDILIPRLKLAQKISRVVDDELVDYGAIYIAESRDDMAPVTVAKAPAKGDVGDGVRIYVHGDPRKGWSWTQPDKQLGRSDTYPDLRLVQGQDPRNVRRTYDYLVTLPDYPDLPVRFLMHGAWGGQAAKQLNTKLLLMRQKGLNSEFVAFKLQARKTSSPQGGQERPFVQAVIGLDKVTAKDKSADMELVLAHQELIGGPSNIRTVEDEDTVQGSTPSSAPSLD